MAYARDGFAAAVEGVSFSDPRMAVFSNVTGRRIASGAEAKKLCVSQIVSPVRWIEEEASILAEKPVFCAETGPGTVLGGLWKAVGGEIPCYPFGTLDLISSVSL